MNTIKKEKTLVIIFLGLLILDIVLISLRRNFPASPTPVRKTWEIESIDTVKHSRDVAREHGSNEAFDKVIDTQMKLISESGANYVAIGTPYDKEFTPFLERWVSHARKNGLKIWFRGNFSGWEGWFEYKRINRAEHTELLKQFILDNGKLFEDGDIFTTCTECENGGPGDPRKTGDTTGHRQFLILEYQTAKNAFTQIGKSVSTNYFPMNYDVAKLVMNKETTQALGGIVVIDHYVDTPEYLQSSIKELSESSGGKIVLGEFGAPIPDIHGPMTDEEQSKWIEKSLSLIAKDENIIGVNYWTAFGGSTRLWTDSGGVTPAVKIISDFFSPKVLSGVVQNEAGQYIRDANVNISFNSTKTDHNGLFIFSYTGANESEKVEVEANGYKPKSTEVVVGGNGSKITLEKVNEDLLFKVLKLFHQNLGI